MHQIFVMPVYYVLCGNADGIPDVGWMGRSHRGSRPLDWPLGEKRTVSTALCGLTQGRRLWKRTWRYRSVWTQPQGFNPQLPQVSPVERQPDLTRYSVWSIRWAPDETRVEGVPRALCGSLALVCIALNLFSLRSTETVFGVLSTTSYVLFLSVTHQLR